MRWLTVLTWAIDRNDNLASWTAAEKKVQSQVFSKQGRAESKIAKTRNKAKSKHQNRVSKNNHNLAESDTWALSNTSQSQSVWWVLKYWVHKEHKCRTTVCNGACKDSWWWSCNSWCVPGSATWKYSPALFVSCTVWHSAQGRVNARSPQRRYSQSTHQGTQPRWAWAPGYGHGTFFGMGKGVGPGAGVGTGVDMDTSTSMSLYIGKRLDMGIE